MGVNCRAEADTPAIEPPKDGSPAPPSLLLVLLLIASAGEHPTPIGRAAVPPPILVRAGARMEEDSSVNSPISECEPDAAD
jgi:hypothetical protein